MGEVGGHVRPPHVLMFLTGALPFGHDWALAAGRVAHVSMVDRYVSAAQRTAIPQRQESVLVYTGHLAGARPRKLFASLSTHLQARALLKALRGLEAVRGPVDVVHSHFYSGALPIALMSRMAGIPFVHTEHSSAFCRAQTLRGRTLSGAGARTARFVFGAAAAVLTVSPYLAREMESTLGVRSDRVIPNPIDVDLFQCHALPSTSDGVRLLHVGRLAEDKGVIGILDAFAKARRADPRLRLTFVGQGPLLQTLRARAEQSGVGPFVEFLGARPRHELPGIFAANHLVVSNAMVETFCVAAAEAMSVGRLVVAPARAALPETLGGAGLLFEPDTGNLRDAILAGVQSLTSWVPEKAHLSVVERFGPAVVAAALSSVYDEVAAHSSRRD